MNRSRLLPVVVASGLLLLAGGAGAQDEPGSGFDSYQLLANAPGVGLDGLYRDVALTVPEVTSSLRTGAVGSGFASLAWPGPIIGNGGSTLLVLSPDLPPETVLLNSPVRAEARTGGVPEARNESVPGTVMAATAKPDEATAAAAFDTTASPVGSFGAMTARSRVALDGAAKAVSESMTVAQDVSLAGGVVAIGSVVSRASVHSDGVRGAAEGSTTVSGLTVAGIPVTVDGSGITVQDQQVPNPLPAQTVSEAVKALGLQILLSEPRSTVSGGSASYQAGALVVLYTQGGDDYALTFGRASASIAAVRATGQAVAPVDRPVVMTAPAAVPGAPELGPGPVAAGPAVDVTDDAPAPDAQAPRPADDSAVLAAPATPVASGLTTFAPVALVLGGGAPTLLALAGLAAATLLAAGLRRLPDRLLTLPPRECDERLSR